MRFGFERLKLQEIVANTSPANTNSRRAMCKIGMSHRCADDFDRPLVPAGHPLKRQVLYRISFREWSRNHVQENC